MRIYWKLKGRFLERIFNTVIMKGPYMETDNCLDALKTKLMLNRSANKNERERERERHRNIGR